METHVRKFLDLRIPMSPELILGMALAIASAAIAGAYALVLQVGP